MIRLFHAVMAVLCLGGAASAQTPFDNANLPDGGALTIQRITPDGDGVFPSNQIVIEFNRPVVAIGKMERSAAEIPVEISPALTCQWHWITTRTLACELDEKQKMRPATAYKVVVKPGIKTLDGVTIAETVEHRFTTVLPQSRWANLMLWRNPGRPVLRMVWTLPVSKASLLEHVYLADSHGNHYAVSAEADRRKRTLPKWLPVPGEKEVVGLDQLMRGDEAPTMVKGEEYRRAWIIEPSRDLPRGETITVASDAGVVSSEGPEPSEKNERITVFDTFPDFQFLGVQCTANASDENELLFKPGDKQKPEELCNPMRAISLSFSAPVDRKALRDWLSIDPMLGKPGDPTDVWGLKDQEEDDTVRMMHRDGATYRVTLPYGLKAAQTYQFSLKNPDTGWWNRLLAWIHPAWADQGGLRDMFGDPLPGPVAMSFATDHRRPNLVMDYKLAVLEKNTDSEVPIYVNNLDTLSWSYNRLTLAGAAGNRKFEKPVPKVPDIQFAMPVGVRDMLDNQSGAIWATLTSKPSVVAESDEGPVRRTVLFAEVTPFQVQVKLGHFNSAVWVTDLATGQPVPGATVEIYRDNIERLAGPSQAAATGRTDGSGIALLPGTEQIDPLLTLTQDWRDEADHFFVHVSKGKDMALLPLSQAFQVNSYRATGYNVFPQTMRRFGHMLTWGTTAQGIYHPGDSIQYKFYVRNQDNQSLVAPPRKGYWLELVDPTGKVVKTVRDITLSEFGGASGEIPLAKSAAVGWYNFMLHADFNQPPQASGNPACQPGAQQDEDGADDGAGNPACRRASEFTWTPMRVMVGDFTPVPFNVRNQLNGDLFHPGDRVAVETEAKLHSGGPYTQAQARITAILTPQTFTSRNPAAAGFSFGAPLLGLAADQQIYQVTEPLDDKGEHKASFPIDDNQIIYGRLSVESAVRDDRGKYVAHQAAADFLGVDRLVGLRLGKWFYSVKDEIAPDFIVVDERGNPVKGAAAQLSLTRQQRVTAKVKSAGNAYVPDTRTEWVKEAECKGVSDETGKPCAMKVSHAGEYKLTATVADSHGRTQTTEVSLYVTGPDFVLWDDSSDSSVEIVADHDQYHVGDTAHYLIKNPYPGAEALITVERYGVLDRFVTTLKDSATIFDLPIKPDYLPGFYLSVVITSPRVDKPVEIGQVDLGKPTFRMGYARSMVKDRYKEIAVAATTDRDTYRPGDKVHLSLKAQPRNGKNEPIELAVVVVDAAVFDLIAQGRAYYDPDGGFNALEGLDLRNYSLLTRLIGRQKFEKKGANPGGDGGASLDMRSTFKYVSYWNPSLKTDSHGAADIEFTVPDNLTGWRVLAMATTPSDRFGLGEAEFKVNRPTEIRPEMPNQIAEGDRFEGRFSVMNRTPGTRTLTVRLTAEGDVDPALPDHLEKQITLKPYERTLVALPLKAARIRQDRTVGEGRIGFTAEAGDQTDRDGVRHAIPVRKLRSLDVAANYGTTVGDRIEEPVAVPAAIHPDSGSLSVTASPTVIGNLEGAFRYLRDYPYPCWEQLLTRGVMAAQYKTLKPYLSDRLSWPGAETLPGEMLARAADFQAPNGGMAYFIASDQHADPYLSAYTALAFNWLRKGGYAVPDEVERRLHDYLQNFLRHDVAPSFYSAGMTSSVRAVALAALAEDHEADLGDLQRYAPYVKDMNLFGKAHFTLAALSIKGGAELALSTAKAMLNFANETGGKFVFTEQVDDGYSRILQSPLRENCAILSALTALGKTEAGQALAADAPFKLVRTITQTRGGRDHWENTQENMFCANALVDYAAVYEKDKPDMMVAASWLDQPIGSAPLKSFKDPAVTFDHPLTAADAGREGKVTITRSGTGRLYYATRLSYASTDAKAGDTNDGMEIHREYSRQSDGKWQLLSKPYAIRQGDVIRVDLYLNLAAARNFVVVDDPIPGGFEAVNSDLANNSKVDADKGAFQAAGGSLWFKFTDWAEYDFRFWSFNHRELRNEAARFYADYLPPGHYHLSYVVQAIGAGTFAVMPTLAAEMYDPNVYGKTTLDTLSISPDSPP